MNIVDSKRRVTLPKGFAKGDLVEFVPKGEGFTIIRVEVVAKTKAGRRKLQRPEVDELVNRERRNKVWRDLDDAKGW